MALTPAQIKQIDNHFSTGKINEQHLGAYVKNGRITSLDEFAGCSEQLIAALRKILGAQPSKEEQAEWASIAPLLTTPGEELKLRLKAYISHWKPSRPEGNHVDEAETRLSAIDAEIEETGWQNVDLMSRKLLMEHLEKYPGTSHKAEIDDAVWALDSSSQSTSQLRLGIEQYKHDFPQGAHVEEANQILSGMNEWETARDSDNLKVLYEFIQTYPNNPYIEEARLLLYERKSAELTKMKEEFNEYNRDNLFFFIKNNIFSTNELLAEGVVTKESLKILENYEKIKENLPNLNNVIAKCTAECREEHTDIYMFGIPSTGKSCVLAGMVSAPDSALEYNSVVSGGRYADAMVQFTKNGFPPPPTQINYLTTIDASVKDPKGVKHYINLIEMAGEEFAFHIADNEENQVSFEDMGTGITKLLQNNNRKVFFFVIDPTKQEISYNKLVLALDTNGEIKESLLPVKVYQRQCLKRMIDMLRLPENEKILKNVDAMHIIVTKADTLDCPIDQRDEYAKNLIKDEYANLIHSIRDLCSKHGINQATRGIPKLYTFSLGNFYVGNIVGFQDTDSKNLINVIINNTTYIPEESTSTKVKKLFTGSN